MSQWKGETTVNMAWETKEETASETQKDVLDNKTVGDVWSDFIQNTGFHGMNKINLTGRHKFHW